MLLHDLASVSRHYSSSACLVTRAAPCWFGPLRTHSCFTNTSNRVTTLILLTFRSPCCAPLGRGLFTTGYSRLSPHWLVVLSNFLFEIKGPHYTTSCSASLTTTLTTPVSTSILFLKLRNWTHLGRHVENILIPLTYSATPQDETSSPGRGCSL